MAEMLDVFDEDMNWIGVRTREEVHREGYWHQTFQCWLIGRNDEGLYLYFQRRHETKADFPGLLDITAAGHMEAGETREEGFREIAEELGVRPDPSDVRYLGVIRGQYRRDGFVDNEFCHVHAYFHDLPREAFRFADGEVASLVSVPFDEARRLLLGEAGAAEGEEFVPDGAEAKRISIGADDVVPHQRAYYESFFAGLDRRVGG